MKNQLHFLKLLVYRFFNTFLGKGILRLLKPLVYVKNLKRTNKKNNHPFFVAITIDAESGYVKKNERRVWQIEKPDVFIGFYAGIRNWRKILDKYTVKGTFFLSTQCFDAKKIELSKIKSELKILDKEGHEIGLHLHPDSDFSLQKHMKNNFKYASAKFYDYKDTTAMLRGSKALIESNLGKKIKDKIVSFRWGNWALNKTAVKALQATGFKIDSSAVPGIKGHLKDHMHYDWSNINHHHPWRLSLTNHQRIKTDESNILEIPIATFNFLGFTLRADPVNSHLLLNTFNYYYKNADRSEKPFIFVVITHSPESIHLDGKKTLVVDCMEDFLKEARKPSDVKFITLREAYTLFGGGR